MIEEYDDRYDDSAPAEKPRWTTNWKKIMLRVADRYAELEDNVDAYIFAEGWVKVGTVRDRGIAGHLRRTYTDWQFRTRKATDGWGFEIEAKLKIPKAEREFFARAERANNDNKEESK